MIDPIDDELTFRSHWDLIGRELQKAQDALRLSEKAEVRPKGAAFCSRQLSAMRMIICENWK